MFQNLDVFRIASAMAQHAGTRQAVVAQNIANADTPGYKARDVMPFVELMQRDGTAALKGSRSGHLLADGGPGSPDISTTRRSESSPNGNSVTLEEEMLVAVDVKRQHDRALAIYRSSLTILRASLAR